jgi:hypothetical protein
MPGFDDHLLDPDAMYGIDPVAPELGRTELSYRRE